VLRDSTLAPDDHRAAIDAAAALTHRLIEAGLWFRDLKPSNVILDETGRARLIDTGSVERARRRARVERMTATMQRVLSRQHIDPRLIERYRQMVAPTGR
jgi:serine/threonine protein kinase